MFGQVREFVRQILSQKSGTFLLAVVFFVAASSLNPLKFIFDHILHLYWQDMNSYSYLGEFLDALRKRSWWIVSHNARRYSEK